MNQEQKCTNPQFRKELNGQQNEKDTPGKLVFKVLKDDILDFSEGSPVRMKVDGDNVFLVLCSSNNGQKTKLSQSPPMTSCDI